MSRKNSAGKAITASIVFLGIFCLITKGLIWVAAVLAVYVTARIMCNLR